MVPAKSLTYWVGMSRKNTVGNRPYKGPTHGALVFPDGSFLVVDFEDHGTWNVVSRNCERAVGWALGRGGVNTASWSASARNRRGSVLSAPAKYNTTGTLATVAKEILATLAASEAEIDALEADPKAHLTDALSRHDWFACYSDDFGVASGGERHYVEIILPLVKKLPADLVRALWDKYAPKECVCPV